MELKQYIPLVLLASALVAVLYYRRWKKYDPEWLITLAKDQYPEDIDLHEAIARCTRIRGEYFVNKSHPNQPGSEWQFEKSVTLEHPEMDEIILDVLKDGRIGSIEYLGLSLRK